MGLTRLRGPVVVGGPAFRVGCRRRSRERPPASRRRPSTRAASRTRRWCASRATPSEQLDRGLSSSTPPPRGPGPRSGPGAAIGRHRSHSSERSRSTASAAALAASPRTTGSPERNRGGDLPSIQTGGTSSLGQRLGGHPGVPHHTLGDHLPGARGRPVQRGVALTLPAHSATARRRPARRPGVLW